MLSLLENGLDDIAQKPCSDLASIFNKGTPITLNTGTLQEIRIKSLPIADFAVEQHIFICDDSTSTFDIAHKLVEEELFPEFSSVLCSTQSGGRGQLRRHWHSEKGNIYAALRLPKKHPFDTDIAALALGGIIVKTFNNLGFEIALKWPNDLIQKSPQNTWEKVCGILLEERNNALIAGIGINIDNFPPVEALRKDFFLEAGILKQNIQKKISSRDIFLSHALMQSAGFYGQNIDNNEKNQVDSTKNTHSTLTMWGLWLALVESIFLWYKEQSLSITPNNTWHGMAEEYLAFKDGEICIHHALFHNHSKEETCVGRIVGVDQNGALLLDTNIGIKSIIGGSLFPLEHETRS